MGKKGSLPKAVDFVHLLVELAHEVVSSSALLARLHPFYPQKVEISGRVAAFLVHN